MKTDNRESDESKEYCNICGETFESKHGVKVHKGMSHPKDTRTVKECKYCGEEFEAPSSRTSRKYCSKKCQSDDMEGEIREDQRKRVEVQCDYCEEVIEKRPCRVTEHNFCCVECKGKWMEEKMDKKESPSWKGGKELRECKGKDCQKLFLVWPSVEKRFCSDECRKKWKSENWTGEKNPRYKGKITMECMYCGEEFEFYPFEAEYRKYCSLTCFNKGTEGGYEVEELDHVVRSSWEEKIAILLKNYNIPYRYEGESFEIEIGENTKIYTPDFILKECDIIIEPHNFFDEGSIRKYASFNEQYPQYTFVILSHSYKKPETKICDVYIPWSDRNSLTEVIEDGV